MALARRGGSRLVVTALAAALLAVAFPARAHDPGITIGSVRGRGSTVTVRGAAHVPHEPRLVADAGDSQTVEVGTSFTQVPVVSGARGPLTYAWTGPGKITVAPTGAATIDTKGVPAGVHTWTVAVTDTVAKKTVRDAVKHAVVARTQILRVSRQTVVGIPDEFFDAHGSVDGQSHPIAFRVPQRTRRLDLTLDWGVGVVVAGTSTQDYDLYVDDPSDRYDPVTTGATAAKPEVLSLPDPAAGAWTARVDAFLTVPDTFTLTAMALVAPDMPVVTADGPFGFDPTDTQRLTASVRGGAAPVSVAWDTDMDGVFERAGTAVTTELPLGNHLVAVKATDANGFERREVTAVRVVPPAAKGSKPPIVVVAVNDTGINMYHRDFSAATYPDERVLALTKNFTLHPSTYIPGYPTSARALPVTLGKGHLPPEDKALFTRANIPEHELFWIPGTKIVGAVDDGEPADPDELPILDEHSHGTASASVAVGNLYGYCPTCLLVATEGFDSTVAYTSPWVDFVSNSWGPLIPTAPPLFPADVPKDSSDRGQMVLFAAGNGVYRTFLAPNDTYNYAAGPDWVVRVGAADSRNRMPVIGDGNPVDVTSFGNGPIPSATNGSDRAWRDHSGTSAATPITTGVMGAVLTSVREALGDTTPGQEHGAAVAVGRALRGPYLADGRLTRDELWEAVLKSATPSPNNSTHLFQGEAPQTPASYVFEGYGIVDGATIGKALDVLHGRTVLPGRGDVDRFLAADSALRKELYGDWSGEKPANRRRTGAATTSATGNPFAGVRQSDVRTLADVLALMERRTPAAVSATAETDGTGSSPSRPAEGFTFTAPAADAVIDVAQRPTIAVTGRAPATAGLSARGETRRFFLRQADCGSDDDGQRLSTVDGPDEGQGCTNVLQPASVLGAYSADVFGAVDGLPLAIDTGRNVSGTIHLRGFAAGAGGVSPLHTLEITLRTGRTVLGTRTVTVPMMAPATTPFPFSFPVGPEWHGVPLESLALHVTMTRSTGLYHIRMDTPPSTLDVPILSAAGGAGTTPAGAVDVSVDDPSFRTPARATIQPNGTWGTNVLVSPLKPGRHLLRARLADGTVILRGIDVVRSATSIVQVQLVPAGTTPSEGAWVTARDTSRAKDLSAWSASVRGVRRGTYDVHARIVSGGVEVARAPSQRFRRR